MFRDQESSAFSKLSLQIFNRWGKLVFATTKSGGCWNGYYKGIGQPNGVFVYILKAKSNCRSKNVKGSVTLARQKSIIFFC